MNSLGAVPDNFVAAVIGAGVAAWLLTPVPVRVLSVNGVAGVPTGNGFEAKSAGLSPPFAVKVPAAAVELAGVFGSVGRFAAYWIELVACAGMKLFWNCRTCRHVAGRVAGLGVDVDTHQVIAGAVDQVAVGVDLEVAASRVIGDAGEYRHVVDDAGRPTAPRRSRRR